MSRNLWQEFQSCARLKWCPSGKTLSCDWQKGWFGWDFWQTLVKQLCNYMLSSSAITSRSLLCLQFTKGPLLQISVWSTVLGSPQIHLEALFGIMKLYRKQIASWKNCLLSTWPELSSERPVSQLEAPFSLANYQLYTLSCVILIDHWTWTLKSQNSCSRLLKLLNW